MHVYFNSDVQVFIFKNSTTIKSEVRQIANIENKIGPGPHCVM